MHLHWLQHVPFEGLGFISTWLDSRQIQQSVTRLYQQDTLPELTALDGLIIMGGPMGVNDDAQYPWLAGEKQFIRQCIDAGKPVLGICLGAQLIASVLGASVAPNPHKEIGWFGISKVVENNMHPLAQFLPDNESVFHWHGDRFEIPDNCIRLYESIACANQAFVYRENVLALQFHMETLPENAESLLQHCADELVLAEYIQSADAIRENMHLHKTMNSTLETILDFIFSV